MIYWWNNLSLRGKWVFWGCFGIGVNLFLLLLGLWMPKLLFLSIGFFVVAAFMKGDGSSENHDAINPSKLPAITTGTVGFKTNQEKIEGLLDAVSNYFDNGLGCSYQEVAGEIKASPKFEPCRKEFRISYRGQKSSLVICWTCEDNGVISVAFEVSKDAVPHFKSIRSTFAS